MTVEDAGNGERTVRITGEVKNTSPYPVSFQANPVFVAAGEDQVYGMAPIERVESLPAGETWSRDDPWEATDDWQGELRGEALEIDNLERAD